MSGSQAGSKSASKAGLSLSSGLGSTFVQPGDILWCEFVYTTGCKMRFAGRDCDAWAEHIHEDIGDKLPSQLLCWFCDTLFDARDCPRDDPEQNFTNRMRHILEDHILGRFATEKTMKPDGFTIKRAYKNGKMSKADFEAGMAAELPPALRYPGWEEAYGEVDPPNEERDLVAVDTAKEDRDRRREERDRKGKGKERAK